MFVYLLEIEIKYSKRRKINMSKYRKANKQRAKAKAQMKKIR